MNMKKLSVAILGLAGFAFAGMAAAACPTDSVPPWSSKSMLGGNLTISTPGFGGTECKLDAKIVTNAPNVAAFVRDNSPANELRYRAQFTINADALGSLNAIQTVKVFGASTDNAPTGFGNEVVRIGLFGNVTGSQKFLSVFTACAGVVGGLCNSSVPLAAGNNVVEFDWNQAAGSFKLWVNNNTEASATLTIPADSTGWSGVDFAVLGLSGPSAGFRAAHLNQVVSVDQFDSRRQTFIGY